jgi:hypothetical protein
MKRSSGCRAARLCACLTLLVCLGLQLAAAEVIANPIAAAKGGQSTISSSAKQQPAASKPAEATPRRGFLKPRGVKQPAKPAGSSGSLPRPLLLGKGSGALRQAAGGAGGAGGAGAGDTTDVLPFCEPRVGVICTNNDNVINFLETEADPIAFDGTPFFEVGTQGEVRDCLQTLLPGAACGTEHGSCSFFLMHAHQQQPEAEFHNYTRGSRQSACNPQMGSSTGCQHRGAPPALTADRMCMLAELGRGSNGWVWSG